jgi:DNA-binding transcriptional LysR family regulator
MESLKYFLAVIDSNSFSKAALEEDISQSSLSKHIRQLEKDLKVTLFDRNTHKLALTDAGRVFAAYAGNIVKQYNLMVASMEQYSTNLKINLRIMCMPILNIYNIADMILAFRKAHPMVKLQLIEAEVPTILSEMDRQTIDVIVVRETVFPHNNNTVFHRIIDDELVLLCSVNHRFGKRETLNFSELTDVHFLLMMPGVLDFVGRLLLSGGLSVDLERNSTLVRNEQNIPEQLSDGASAMLVSSALANRYTTNEQLVAIPFKVSMPFSVAIGIDKDNHSPILREFIEFGLAYFNRRPGTEQ